MPTEEEDYSGNRTATHQPTKSEALIRRTEVRMFLQQIQRNYGENRFSRQKSHGKKLISRQQPHLAAKSLFSPKKTCATAALRTPPSRS